MKIIAKLALATLVAPVALAASEASAQKLTFTLNWVAGGDHAPYFYAQKMGWYKQAGIDVEFESGRGSAASAQVNVPVWNWGASRSRVRQAEYQLQVSRNDLSLAQRSLLAQLDSFYREAEVASSQSASLKRSVDLARESLRGIRRVAADRGRADPRREGKGCRKEHAHHNTPPAPGTERKHSPSGCRASPVTSSIIWRRYALRSGGEAFPWKRFQVRTSMATA